MALRFCSKKPKVEFVDFAFWELLSVRTPNQITQGQQENPRPYIKKQKWQKKVHIYTWGTYVLCITNALLLKLLLPIKSDDKATYMNVCVSTCECVLWDVTRKSKSYFPIVWRLNCFSKQAFKWDNEESVSSGIKNPVQVLILILIYSVNLIKSPLFFLLWYLSHKQE
jgi:hypothetical protein